MIKIKLQGHEKFILREGWLNKGLEIISDDASNLSGVQATDYLGVGTNMVKSIKYWLKATNLISNSNKKEELVDIIYKNDLYFEDLFTIWIIHSNLVRNKEYATTWYLFFNKINIIDFTKEEMFAILKNELVILTGTDNFSDRSLNNDIDVLLKMYEKASKDDDPEDKNVSPLSKLKLLKNENGKHIKCAPDMRQINEWVVLYEIANLLDGEDSISIDKIVEGDCSVGNIYNLSRVAINQLLDGIDLLGYIKVDRTAGLDMIYKLKDFTPKSIVEDYYKYKGR